MFEKRVYVVGDEVQCGDKFFTLEYVRLMSRNYGMSLEDTVIRLIKEEQDEIAGLHDL